MGYCGAGVKWQAWRYCGRWGIVGVGIVGIVVGTLITSKDTEKRIKNLKMTCEPSYYGASFFAIL